MPLPSLLTLAEIEVIAPPSIATKAPKTATTIATPIIKLSMMTSQGAEVTGVAITAKQNRASQRLPNVSVLGSKPRDFSS
jgi:hypothetical protein